MSTRPFSAPSLGPLDLTPGVSQPAYDTAPILTNVSPNSDRLVGGVAVTITGKNFVGPGTTSVSIGGAAATSVVVVSSTQITCNAPAHATGVVDVSVTNGFGQVGTLAQAFVYVSPFITGITPNHGPLAGGTTVVIEGGNFASGSGVTFGGVAATSVTFIDENHYSCVTPAHAVGPVTVVVGSATFDEPFFYTLLTRGEDIRRMPGIRISERIGNLPNTCSFTVDGQSSPPQAGEVIQILDYMDSNRQLYKGVVQTVEQIYEEQTTQLAWQVDCADFTFWLNRRRPFGQYTNVSVTSIVLDLVAKYAPWVDTSFVQTALCNVNVAFDGSQTFGECLSILARMLGGGHWYLDYSKRLHFFRVTGLKGSVTATPENPSTTINPKTGQPGVGAAMTAAIGGLFPDNFSHTSCWAAFYSTFVYDNGLESALSKLSNVVQCDGTHYVTLSNVPVGSVAGTLTPVKRKIYAQVYAPGTSEVRHILTIENNTLTAVNVGALVSTAGALAIMNPGVANLIAGSLLPARKAVPTPPKVNVGAPTLSLSSTSLTALWNAAGFGGGLVGNTAYAQVKVTGVYQDGTESQPSAASSTLQMTPGVGLDVIAPIFPDINGVSCIFVKVWFAVAPTEPSWTDPSNGFGNIIPNNLGQRTSLYYFYSLGQGYAPPEVGEVGEVDPCTGDGPYLEDSLPQPTTIDANDLNILHDPPLVTRVDISQIRNRIFVRGGGTVTMVDAPAGSSVLEIADASALPPGGGDVVIGSMGLHAQMLATDATSGQASIALVAPLTQPIPSGSAVRGLAVVSDRESQRLMGLIELDDNGNPTDGVHEYFIDDASLTSFDQQINRAYAELELFSRPVITATYATRDSNSHPGRKVTFNLDHPPVKGEFLIQSVAVDQIHDESDQLLPRYTVQASSVRFDLEDLLVMIANGTKVMSSPGSGDFVGVSSGGIKERAVVESKTYTDTAIVTQLSNVGALIGVRSVTFTLPNSAILTLNSIPYLVIPAQPGKIISPIRVVSQVRMTAGYSGARTVQLFYEDNLSNALNTALSCITVGALDDFQTVDNTSNNFLTYKPAGKAIVARSNGDVTGGSDSNIVQITVVYLLFDALP